MSVSSIYRAPVKPYSNPPTVPNLYGPLWDWLARRLDSPTNWSVRVDGNEPYFVGPLGWQSGPGDPPPRGSNGAVLPAFEPGNVLLYSVPSNEVNRGYFDITPEVQWQLDSAIFGSPWAGPPVLSPVMIDRIDMPGAQMLFAYMSRDALKSLLDARRDSIEQRQANDLWSQAWQGASFDANYNNWLRGVANDPLRSVTGTKVNLTIAVSSVIRSKTEAVLQLNSRMADMNVLLKRLNTMAAENKGKPDTDWAFYVKGIPIGSSFTGGNQWAAQEKPIWDSWGIDTSKFHVDTRSGKGDVYCDKAYIEPTIEALKIALEKASSDAQQLQLDLNNLMTQYNGQFDAASAIYKRKDTLDQSLQPR